MERMRRAFSLALIAALAAGSTACSSNSEPVPIPTPIAEPTITDTFTGVVFQSGNFQYQFKINVDSQVLVTLASVTSVAVEADPNAAPPVAAKPSVPVSYPLSVRIGQSSLTTLGLTCTNLKEVTTTAGAAPQLTGQALSGTFCVDVSDQQGTLPEPVNITVTIGHS
jgi:hypothetical protein